MKNTNKTSITSRLGGPNDVNSFTITDKVPLKTIFGIKELKTLIGSATL